VPPTDLSPDEGQRATLYCSLTAGKSIAVLLDDADSSTQVAMLLPASPHSVVVVTSRRRLSGLVAHGVITVAIDVLPPDTSVELLSRAVGRARAAAEPEPARQVADLCGGMPIALHVAAARLAVRPHWPLASVATELADERHRLRSLVAEDEHLSVVTCFDLSYHGLPPVAARLYRLLGLYPGPDFGKGVAAAITGTTEAAAEHDLGVLVDASRSPTWPDAPRPTAPRERLMATRDRRRPAEF
jgi:hypothetical protein